MDADYGTSSWTAEDEVAVTVCRVRWRNHQCCRLATHEGAHRCKCQAVSLNDGSEAGE